MIVTTLITAVDSVDKLFQWMTLQGGKFRSSKLDQQKCCIALDEVLDAIHAMHPSREYYVADLSLAANHALVAVREATFAIGQKVTKGIPSADIERWRNSVATLRNLFVADANVQ